MKLPSTLCHRRQILAGTFSVILALGTASPVFSAPATNAPAAKAPSAKASASTNAPAAAAPVAEIDKETGKPIVTTASGLKYVDVVVGKGAEAKAGDHVSVNYTGKLIDGSKFDSSYDRGVPIPFILGVGMVIKGWDEGISGMKVGGKRKLIIPSTLGYGMAGQGDVIPPNATLIFDTELVSIDNAKPAGQ